MSQWYCAVDGKKYGPVNDLNLRQWITEGRVKADDLVWTEGMLDWVKAEEVFPTAFEPLNKDGSLGNTMVPAGADAGTGGKTPNFEITAQARRTMDGRWGIAIGAALIVGFINGFSGAIPYIGGLIQLIVSGAMILGQVIFFLTYVRKGPTQIALVFRGFKSFGRAIGTYILMALLILGWTAIAAIPAVAFLVAGFALVENQQEALAIPFIAVGCVAFAIAIVVSIWAQMRYSQSFYILADDKSIDCLEAIKRSKNMMDGYKAKLFFLQLRFLGWIILSILTLGIGFIFLAPYMLTAFTIFYEDLRTWPVHSSQPPVRQQTPPDIPTAESEEDSQ